jgi:hypothetical protein
VRSFVYAYFAHFEDEKPGVLFLCVKVWSVFRVFIYCFGLIFT